MTIDLIQRATEVRTKLGLPDKAFIVFVLAPGKQAAMDLRNAKGMPNGLGINLYASNIEIEVIDIDSKNISVIRGISALHCITRPEYWEAAPDFVKKAIQNSLAVTAAILEVSVQTLITGPEVLVKDSKCEPQITQASYKDLQATIERLHSQVNEAALAIHDHVKTNERLHIKLAAAELNATQGWQRYEEANRDRNHLRSLMVKMPYMWRTNKQAVFDHMWDMYKTGQISADHTAKQVFEGALDSFALWIAEQVTK